MHLARFPRVFLAHLSTPLEPMERLSKELGVEICEIKTLYLINIAD